MIDRQCAYCSKPFRIKACIVKRGRGKFCSTACRDAGRDGGHAANDRDTSYDERITALWHAGHSAIQIAALVGLSHLSARGKSRVLQIAHAIGLSRPSSIGQPLPTRALKVEFGAIMQMRRDGMEWGAVADRLGVTQVTRLRRWFCAKCRGASIEQPYVRLAKPTPAPVVRTPRAKKARVYKPRVKAAAAPRPAPEKPVAAPTCVWLERGRPGVAQPPVALPWPRVREIAANEAWPLGGLHDLPAYNRSRITRGYAPLAIRRAA